MQHAATKPENSQLFHSLAMRKRKVHPRRSAAGNGPNTVFLRRLFAADLFVEG
jgi:hypothetical protein